MIIQKPMKYVNNQTFCLIHMLITMQYELRFNYKKYIIGTQLLKSTIIKSKENDAKYSIILHQNVFLWCFLLHA